MRRILALAAIMAAFAVPALAQQPDPTGFRPDLPYVTAWDGSHFQVLETTVWGNGSPITDTDQAATASAVSAYVAAHPAPVVTPVTPAPPPVVVTRYQFLLLFTPQERAAFLAMRGQASALQPADFTSTDPTKQALVGLASFDYVLDNMGPSDTIEMADPETVQAMNLLVSLGVLTSTREAVVLTGVRP